MKWFRGRGLTPYGVRPLGLPAGYEGVFRPSDEFASQAEDPVCDWIIVAEKGVTPWLPNIVMR